MSKQLFSPDVLTAMIQEAKVDPTKPPPAETVVFRIEFQNIGSFGNFVLFTGLPKAGKGKYIAGLTAASLTREDIFSLQVKLPPKKTAVQYWDTEQSKHDHFQHLNLINRLCGDKTPKQFTSYHCRKHDPAAIIAMVEHELRVNKNTGIVILDGLLDMVESFNDEKQSKQLVNFLKRITDEFNILVIAVLHRSKSVDKSVGHLGSAADRAAQSVLVVEKDKERKQYILKPEYLRNADTFTPIAIYYNKQLELWEQTEYMSDPVKVAAWKPKKATPQELDLLEHTVNVSRCFNNTEVQTYEQLVQNIREVYGVGRNWAVDCVKYLTQKVNLVFRIETGYTNRKQARMFIEK